MEASLNELAYCDLNGMLEPPLTPNLSDVLQRASNSQLVNYRWSTDEDPEYLVPLNGKILETDNTPKALKLLQIIAVHGGVSGFRSFT